MSFELISDHLLGQNHTNGTRVTSKSHVHQAEADGNLPNCRLEEVIRAFILVEVWVGQLQERLSPITKDQPFLRLKDSTVLCNIMVLSGSSKKLLIVFLCGLDAMRTDKNEFFECRRVMIWTGWQQ